MRLIRPALAGAKGPIFQGPVTSASVLSELAGSHQLKVSLVRFEAGARTRWHRHDGDQLLIVADGRGHIGSRDETLQVGPGDSVLIPAGQEHYHSAAGDCHMAHYSLLAGSSTDLLEEAGRHVVPRPSREHE